MLYPIIPCILSLLLLLSSCKKEKEKDPLLQLPPETQIGANTFGCLINGEVFKPGGAQLSGGSLSCNYQKVDGEYYFRLVANDDRNKHNRKSVSVFSYKSQILENEKFVLEDRFVENKFYGLLSRITPDLGYIPFETDSIHQGELWIKYFDTVGQVVSGTFWFDAVSETGEAVQVREGRFDVRYTR